MAKRRYGKRNRYGNRYVARNTKGQFISNVDVGRSLKADKRRTAKNYKGAGYGQQGDTQKKSFFAHGGMDYYEGQGYNDKMDESMGMSHRESKMKQSMKDRRDESAGMEKHMNRRKYSRVGTMDKSAEMGVPMNYPEGDGRILGQSTASTNFTPAGLHAENFNGESMGDFKTGFITTFGVIGALITGGMVLNLLGMGSKSDE